MLHPFSMNPFRVHCITKKRKLKNETDMGTKIRCCPTILTFGLNDLK